MKKLAKTATVIAVITMLSGCIIDRGHDRGWHHGHHHGWHHHR
ncbi:hypothetical protein [Pantoea sp. KPR_PJ]